MNGENMKEVSDKTPKWRDAEYHRKEILNIIDKIEDSWILWQVHRFVINITKDDD
ncbi:MAG: hypothetical protein K2J60_07870 [Acetatifactor sp.]|nr:hypothetical protein [Acetatifactor sp.]